MGTKNISGISGIATICLSIHLYACMSVCIYISVCQSVCLFVHLSVYTSIYTIYNKMILCASYSHLGGEQLGEVHLFEF